LIAATASAPAGSTMLRVDEHVLDRGADGVGVHQHEFVDQLAREAEGSPRPPA
jgi:hypothetical protein